MTTIHPAPLLRQALLTDAVVSGATGLLQLAGGRPLADLLQLPGVLLQGTGLFLLGYVAVLLLLAKLPRVPAACIALIVVGNVGWAVGCLVLQAQADAALGQAFLLVQAVAVLGFAGWQAVGLRRSRAAASGAVLA